MKHFLKRMLLFVVLTVMTVVSGYAQETSEVEKKVNEMVKKYEGTVGVDCLSLVKGRGLEMVKMLLNKELGKRFLKGVTSITVIDYSDASEETCQSLRKDLNGFLILLEEFTVGEEEAFADNDYIRSFARTSESGTLSDFVIALEDKDLKTIMYMAGEIKVENDD